MCDMGAHMCVCVCMHTGLAVYVCVCMCVLVFVHVCVLTRTIGEAVLQRADVDSCSQVGGGV